RARVPGTIPTIAVATAADSMRGFVVTGNGRILRLCFEKGRVASCEEVTTLTPPATAARFWLGAAEGEDRVALAIGHGSVLRGGAGFAAEIDLTPYPTPLAAVDALQSA